MVSICQEGIDNAVEVMKAGLLNRYQMGKDADTNYLLKTERALAQYIYSNSGSDKPKYCIGLNSGASAIYLALKCADIPLAPGAPVLSNAFTFNAVPSAIAHAGGKAVLVECTDDLVIDLEDLKKKAIETKAKHLVLSYMRGRIPDMDKVMNIVSELQLYLIEDAAHAYGCMWGEYKIGSFGESSTMSTQANKVMNSGEGGFLCTQSDKVMAKAIISAGSYEQLFEKHCEMSPPEELMRKYRKTMVNCSLRMTNLQGAILYPQVAKIDKRRETHNKIYAELTKALGQHTRIYLPEQPQQVTPVYDSLQFEVDLWSTEKELEEKTREEIREQSKVCTKEDKEERLKRISAMTALTKEYTKEGTKEGVKLELFGGSTNARNWRTWEFLGGLEKLELPETERIIGCTLDTRLSLEMTSKEIESLVYGVHKAIDEVTAPMKMV